MSRTLIIGAGPAGLATARCLQTRGIDYTIIDGAATVGHAWRSHYARLHLHTVKEESGLPDLPMPAAWPRYVSRAQVVEYLDDYARRFGIVPAFQCSVVGIERESDRWQTTLATGEALLATHVVMATGVTRQVVTPDYPGLATTSLPVMHSRDYRHAKGLGGRRVLVIGMGNTGAEIALDLHEQGALPTISVRGPVNLVHRETFGFPIQRTALLLDTLPPAIGGWVGRVLQHLSVGHLDRWGLGRPAVSAGVQLRATGKTPVIDVGTLAAIKRGAIAVRPAVAVFHPDAVEFVDGRSEPFEQVIMATGYRPGLEALIPAVAPMLDPRGYPRELWGTGPLGGLAFVGFRAYDPGGILRNIRLDAPRVADHIAGR